MFRTEKRANLVKNRISLPNKATESKIQNNFEDDQVSRRREIISKLIDNKRVSRTPDLHQNNKNNQASGNDQIHKSAGDVMINIKIKLIQKAYKIMKRLLYFKPKL